MSFVQSFTAVLMLLLMSATRVIIAQDDQQCRAHLSDPPLLPGISCEDIYNKNQQTHDQSGYYWILNGPSRVYCGMNYIGSSCEEIYNAYSVTRDKSGFYRISNNAWVYCGMNYIGSSCEEIYNAYSVTRDKSGFYRMSNNTWVYCGMNYIGSSCEDIYNTYSVTRDKSGFYRMSNNTWVYCDMRDIAIAFSRGEFISSCTGMGGVWRRIASFNISAGDECPTGWNKSTQSGVSFCRPPSDNPGCYSTNFSANEMSYTRVCGRARGYQVSSPDGFNRRNNAGSTINDTYVDGLSITCGYPRQHIWTYAVGVTDPGRNADCCPCSTYRGRSPPTFIGSNYYCESGAANNIFNYGTYYLSDPLWDGNGCSSDNTCCSNTNLPWFQHQLTEMTQDDIEVRICRDEAFVNEEILIDILEIYIQ